MFPFEMQLRWHSISVHESLTDSFRAPLSSRDVIRPRLSENLHFDVPAQWIRILLSPSTQFE